MCSFAEVFYMSILFSSLILSLLTFSKKYIFYLPKDFMVLLFIVVDFSILYFFLLHSYSFYNLYRLDILKDTLCHLKRCLHFIFFFIYVRLFFKYSRFYNFLLLSILLSSLLLCFIHFYVI